MFTHGKVLKCSLTEKGENVHSRKSVKMFTQRKVLKCSFQ